MNCPKCGAAVQPYDRFCIRCGHDMQPGGATERGQATSATASYNPATTASYNPATSSPSYDPNAAGPGAEAQAGPVYGGQAPFGGAPPQNGAAGANTNWASGSSTPGPNPFANTPSSFSNGTMLNGRPATGGGGKGIFQGVGAGIVALFVILGKVGGGIAALGFFKLLFYWWLFGGLLRAGLGTLVLVVVVLLIVGVIARNGRVT